MAPLRLALLGCGDVAQRDYLPEFHRLAGRAELVAVCTRTPERLRWAQQHYQIPYGYTEFQQMLAEHAADAVINLTPIPLHDATNRAILEAGYHLYSEKPAARSARSARTLASLAHQHGLQALCAPSIRLFPQLQFVRQLLAEETIGPVHSAHGQGLFGVPPWEGYPSDPTPFFAAGAGPMLDMGVYPLHALTALLGPVRRVTALVARVQESFTVDTGPPPDTTAPDTLIDSGPAEGATIATGEASFAFHGDPAEDTAKLQCKLDSEPFADCSSPKSFAGLADGSHTVAFRAEDAAAGWVGAAFAAFADISTGPEAMRRMFSSSSRSKYCGAVVRS